MTVAASNAGAVEQPLAASQNYQANTVPKTRAAEATNKRHALLILTPFNQSGCPEGNKRNERGTNRRPADSRPLSTARSLTLDFGGVVQWTTGHKGRKKRCSYATVHKIPKVLKRRDLTAARFLDSGSAFFTARRARRRPLASAGFSTVFGPISQIRR